MTESIYLHRYVVETLSMFGELSEVVNRMLKELLESGKDVTECPPCINRNGASRYSINVTQPDYLELIKLYPPNSPRVSLRRILYWFVDNGVYDTLGWESVRVYNDKKLKTLGRYLDNIKSSVERINMLYNNDDKITSMASSILVTVEQIEEYVNNER